MPIYEYRCLDCGRIMEILARSSHRNPELTCSHCRSRNLKKMVSSPAAVRLGGSSPKGKTCCGQDERCATPPCSAGGTCRRD